MMFREGCISDNKATRPKVSCFAKTLLLVLTMCTVHSLCCAQRTTLSDQRTHIYGIGNSPNGRLQIVVGSNTTIFVYQLPYQLNEAPIATFAGRVACFSPNGHFLAVWGKADLTMYIYETDSWQQLVTCDPETHDLSYDFFGSEPLFSANDAVIAIGAPTMLTVYKKERGHMFYSRGEAIPYTRCRANKNIVCLSNEYEQTSIYDIQQGTFISRELCGLAHEISSDAAFVACAIPGAYNVYRTCNGALVKSCTDESFSFGKSHRSALFADSSTQHLPRQEHTKKELGSPGPDRTRNRQKRKTSTVIP